MPRDTQAEAANFPVASARLKSFIERIERLIEEKSAISTDIAGVFSEAKSVGYDVATMRKVIKLHAMDAGERAEQELLLDTYLLALGMIDRVEDRLAAGESVRQAAAAEGISKSAVHRVSQKTKVEPDNAKTGQPKADVITPPEPEDDLQIPPFLRKAPPPPIEGGATA